MPSFFFEHEYEENKMLEISFEISYNFIHLVLKIWILILHV